MMGFYNRRGTAEQHIREGKYAIRRRRLSCRRFRDNEMRLQLHALAYNRAVFPAHVALPEPMTDWSLTSLQSKLIKIGAWVVRHARAITFQLAEVAVTGAMVRAVTAAVHRLRAPPLAACNPTRITNSNEHCPTSAPARRGFDVYLGLTTVDRRSNRGCRARRLACAGPLCRKTLPTVDPAGSVPINLAYLGKTGLDV